MNIIWTSVASGSDLTGDGSYAAPYKSLDKSLSVFVSGDQIRLMDGTYITTDSVIITGVDGSLFSENPLGATIQPAQTRNHQACVVITNSSRFSVIGINILQAADPSGNLVGLYAADVENFVAYTCNVSNFDVDTGDSYGIFGAGTGRIERCAVTNMNSCGDHLTGICGKGMSVIDCSVDAVSGCGDCYTLGIDEDGLV